MTQRHLPGHAAKDAAGKGRAGELRGAQRAGCAQITGSDPEVVARLPVRGSDPVSLLCDLAAGHVVTAESREAHKRVN